MRARDIFVRKGIFFLYRTFCCFGGWRIFKPGRSSDHRRGSGFYYVSFLSNDAKDSDF